MLHRNVKRTWGYSCAAVCWLGAVSVRPHVVEMTLEDFHLSGTQVGDVTPAAVTTSDHCPA